jgi:hypothetical protein
MKFKLAIFCTLGLLAATQASACYTVYDTNNRVLYQGLDAPVDMSLHVKDALRARFPAGAHMAFDQTNQCAVTTVAQVPRASGGHVPAGTIQMERRTQPTSSSPLLTDRRTAASLNLPATPMAGQIVLVPAEAAARVKLPSMTVIPAETFARATPGSNTAILGAGPAPAQGETVITEMNNPPGRYIQRGKDFRIAR